MSGRVFKTIAERVYAQSVQAHVVDTVAPGLPPAKGGKTVALSEVLDELNFNYLSAGERGARTGRSKLQNRAYSSFRLSCAKCGGYGSKRCCVFNGTCWFTCAIIWSW